MIREIVEINRVYIHCTASTYGDFNTVDNWHKERGFSSYPSKYHGRPVNIGYHFLVLNGFDNWKSVNENVASITDGKVIEGRPIEIVGAHVKGDNTHSVGIAYTGFSPTSMQLVSLTQVTLDTMDKYDIPLENVFGHHEYYTNKGGSMVKTCPNIDMKAFRLGLSLYL